MMRLCLASAAVAVAIVGAVPVSAQKYVAPDGRVRVALAQQPFLPNDVSKGPATASAIGFATIPEVDQGGLSIAAVNRMIAAAVRGVRARSGR